MAAQKNQKEILHLYFFININPIYCNVCFVFTNTIVIAKYE